MLVIMESLEVPPSLADFYADIVRVCRVCAAMDSNNRRSRIQRLLWKFTYTLELKPLSLDVCEEITRRWLAVNPVRFSSQAVERAFVRHVAQECRGLPEAIDALLHQAAAETQITPASVRDFRTDAGVRFLDMTPLVLVALVLAMAWRYASRGMGEAEMYILSGVMSALIFGAVIALRKLGAKR
jgi:hypothetical protein